MTSEHSNSLVSLHAQLDSLIQSIGTHDDYTVRFDLLEEDFIVNINDSDILLSLKKHFLLGHIFVQKNQLQQGISHFQQSLLLQDEMSYDEIRVLTLSSLFECCRLTQSSVNCFEYACLLEKEVQLPLKIRKHILETLFEGYSTAGYGPKSFTFLQALSEVELTTSERFYLLLNYFRLQIHSESPTNSKKYSLDDIEDFVKNSDYNHAFTQSYLSFLLEVKEYNRLRNIASKAKEIHINSNQTVGLFWYYEVVGTVKSTKKTISNEERSRIVEQCVTDKQYYYAILVNVFYLTESDKFIENSLEILEYSVKLFDVSIPIEIQVDVLERLVECCENKKEWKKGLYYFELYHNALQTVANENNSKTIETMQIKQYIASIHKHSNLHSHSVSSDISQKRNQFRHQQHLEFEQFLQSIKKYIHSGMKAPLEMLVTLPVQRYSSLLAETVLAVTRSMTIAVETVIELHSLEDGTYNRAFETVSLITIIDKLHSILEILTIRYECFIDIYIDHRIQWYGDVHLLTQIFYHILQNACKFSRTQSRIVLKASMTSSEVIVTITDSGVGVTEEHIALVFSKYFEYDPISTNVNSAGLGLPFCKKALSYLQGTIQLHSKVDVGTEVIVTLPLTSSVSIPSPEIANYSFTMRDIRLTDSDSNLLSGAMTSVKNSNNLSELLTAIDAIQGSNELNDWKRKMYISLLYGEEENVQTLLAQIRK